MRAGNTYRGERRREAKAAGLDWGFLDAIVDTAGTRRITHPFQRLGKTATAQAVQEARHAALAAPLSAPPVHGRYSIHELRRLAAERGVGPVGRVAEGVRAAFKKTKRKG